MITSVQNPAVRFARALRESKRRRASGAFLIEGAHMVEEALLSGAALRDVFYDPDRADAALIAALAAKGCAPLDCAPHVLDALCAARTPQGIAAVADMPAPARPSGRFIVALDGVQDPGNVGAIIRSAEASGVSCVILGEGCADPFGAKAAQASMGSLLRVPLCPSVSLRDDMAALLCDGYVLFAATPGGGDVFRMDALPGKVVLIIGAEGRGVSPVLMDMAESVSLPMGGRVASLNAAAAASILMYHFARLGGHI